MKKWTKALIGGVCLLSVMGLAACTKSTGAKGQKTYNGMTGNEVYGNLMEELEEYDRNFTARTTMDTTMTMTMGKQSQTMSMTMESISMISGEDEYASVSLSGDMVDMVDMGDSEVWYVDGILYEPTSKYAECITMVDYYARLGVDIEDSKLPFFEMTEKVLSGSYFRTEGDEITLNITVSGADVEDFVEQLGSAMTGVDFTMNLSDINYVLHLTKDCELKYMDINYSASTEIMGYKVQYQYAGIIELYDIGETEITPPKDADEYTVYYNGRTPAEACNGVYTYMKNNSNNYTATVDMTAVMGTEKANMSYTVAVVDQNKHYVSSSSVDGETVSNDIWYVDGVAYDAINKTQEAKTWDECSLTLIDFGAVMPDDATLATATYAAEEGGATITLTATGASASDIASEIMGNTVTCEEVTLVLHINEYFNLLSVDFSFAVNEMVDEMNLTATVDGSLTFSKVGDTSIELPDEARGFRGI